MKILLIDSGIGGLSIFAYLKKTFPNNKYTYFMDNKNFPYGQKTTKQMYDIAVNEIKPATKDYDYVIVACNTLSTIIVENNIKLFSPTITMMDLHKITSLQYLNQEVNILATSVSVKSNVWKKIYKQSSLIDGTDLAMWIENKNLKQISVFVKTLPDNKPIILSCTHYNFIKNFIFNSVDVTPALNFFIKNGNDEFSFEYILTKIDKEKISLIKTFT